MNSNLNPFMTKGVLVACAAALGLESYMATPAKPEEGHPREVIFMSNTVATSTAHFQLVTIQTGTTSKTWGRTASPGAVAMIR